GSVLSNHLARQTADAGLHQHLLVIWPDRLVQHGHCIALEPEPENDCCSRAHAVAGDGVVGLRKGLQSQVVQKYLVPKPSFFNSRGSSTVPPPKRFHRTPTSPLGTVTTM